MHTYTIFFISTLLTLMLFLLFLVEVKGILQLLFRKKVTFVDKYSAFNGAFLLLIFTSIHEYLFTDQLFTNCWWVMLAIIACFVIYGFLELWDAKTKSDYEKGNT